MEAFSKTGKKQTKPPRGIGQKLRSIFGRAAEKPEGSGNAFLDAVLRERPDLKNETAYFPSLGVNSYKLILGNEVFKGPRSEGQIGNFEDEADILQKLDGKGLRVPRVTCRGKETVFYGMTRMEGVPLLEVAHSLTAEEQRKLCGDLSDFMIGLAEALPPKSGMYAYHADLQEGNVMVDPQTKRLTGVIDFAYVDYGSKDHLAEYTFLSLELEATLKEEYAARKAQLPNLPQSSPTITMASQTP